MEFIMESMNNKFVEKFEGKELLHITPEAPGLKSGGQIGVLQTLESICAHNEVDYIGPEIEDSDVFCKYRKVYTLKRNDNLAYKILDLLKGVTSTYYRAWSDLSKTLDLNDYDAVILDFTKFDFCIKKLTSKNLIVRVHNIEIDYAAKDYQMRKSLKNFLVLLFQKKAEKAIANAATSLVFLHEKDSKRFIELYGGEEKKYFVPVCVKKPHIKENRSKNHKYTLLLTGSLWFGVNYEGAMWIINKVLPLVKNDYRLIIAGFNPNPKLIETAALNKKIEVVNSPKDMQPFYEEADVILAPVFDGAGMKVKVAEAFSYGLPVIGTQHVFTGYDIEDGKTAFIADSPELFAKYIDDYVALESEYQSIIHDAVNKLFEEKYSIECSIREWNKILSFCTEQ